MKLRWVIKTAAETDIYDLATFIALDSPNSAKRFERELGDKIEQLSEFPRTGHPVEGYRTKLFATTISSRFRKYMIIYTLEGNEILHIVRVLHGSRDISAELSEFE